MYLCFCSVSLFENSLSWQEVTVEHFLSALPCLMSWTLTTSWIECLPQAASSDRALTTSWTLHLYQTLFFVACIFLLYFCLYTAKNIHFSPMLRLYHVRERKWSFRCSDRKHLTGVKPPRAVELHWKHTEASLSLSVSLSLSLSSRLNGISLHAGQRLACCFVFVCNV